jgi:hypothetical protein
MTENQKGYLQDLIGNRQMPADDREWLSARLEDDDVTKEMASAMIGQLVKRPKIQAASESAPVLRDGTIDYRQIPGATLPVGFVVISGVTIPRGSYGVLTPEATNQTSFFRLWIGDYQDDRFHGKMSMDQLIGPEKYKVYGKTRERILRMIAEQDPAECAMRYGLEIGKCGICGRRLTNDLSRKLGIGPVCRENWGWA